MLGGGEVQSTVFCAAMFERSQKMGKEWKVSKQKCENVFYKSEKKTPHCPTSIMFCSTCAVTSSLNSPS